MTSYQFENKKFIQSEAENASLHCFPFSMVKHYQERKNAGDLGQALMNDLPKYFKDELHFSQLENKILSAKNDAYIGHYADYTILSLTLKNYEDPAKNEAVVMILYPDYSLLFYDEALGNAENYI